MKNKIAIVVGEPNSINTEIIAKAYKKINKKKRKKLFLIGNYLLFQKQLKKINIRLPIEEIKLSEINKFSNKLKILNVPLKFDNPFNVSVKQCSLFTKNTLDLAHHLANTKIISGFINCPINKKTAFKNTNMGVTEYLAKKNKKNGVSVMLIYNKDFSVSPITTHIPLKQISRKLSISSIFRKTQTINRFYLQIIKKKPKIAITGLNPHNDELRNNSEEKKIILPAIKKLKKNKVNVIGPISSDSIFFNRKKYNFDVVVGMYHDQVLSPFKSIFKFNAVNITLGLNYLRISPDHGIGKDIMGKKIANPLSLIKSIEFFFKFKK